MTTNSTMPEATPAEAPEAPEPTALPHHGRRWHPARGRAAVTVRKARVVRCLRVIAADPALKTDTRLALMELITSINADLSYGIEEAAEALSIGPTKMTKLLNKGEVAGFHVGDRRLVAIADIESYVAEQIAREGLRA